MQEYDQALGAPVQHPVVLGAHMAAQLPQLSVDLGAVWIREVRHPVGEIVQPIELSQQGGAALGIEARDEFKYRLDSVRGAVIDRL